MQRLIRLSKNLFEFFLIYGVCATILAAEKPYQIEEQKAIAPSILYQKLRFPSIHNLTVHAVICNIKDPSISIKPCIAGDRIEGVRETVQSMARRNGAVVGVNVSYYGYWNTKTPIGDLLEQMVIDREIISSINALHRWHNGALGITKEKFLMIEAPLQYESELILAKGEKLNSVLVNPLEWDETDQILLYTDKVGNIPLSLKNKTGIEAEFISPKRLLINAPIRLRVTRLGTGLVPSPKRCVIYGMGSYEKILEKRAHQKDNLSLRIAYPGSWADAQEIIGGAPQILKDGDITIQDSPMEQENRTAIGILKNGQMLIVCTDPSTWHETSMVMRQLDVNDALMLDGGGSSALILNGKNVFPAQRCVGDSLLIFSKKADA